MIDEMLLLSEEDVCRLLQPEDVIRAADLVFQSCARGEAVHGPIGMMPVDEEKRNIYMTFPAALRNLNVAGMKWFCGYNKSKLNLPFGHGSLLILADLETGCPLALMSANSLTAMRTAGGHGVVGAKYLANPNPKKLTVVGTGAQARSGIRGFLTQFPSIKQVNIWGRTKTKQEQLCDQFADQVCAVPVSDLCSAVGEADVLLMATSSMDVLVKADWISPGTTVVAISAFTDLDPSLSEKADKWIVGSYREDMHGIVEDPKCCHGYPLDKDRIWAQLPDIISGARPGREREDEIILFTHMGMGFFDIACGKIAYEHALAQNVGKKFVLE